jgi:hypothetical protein
MSAIDLLPEDSAFGNLPDGAAGFLAVFAVLTGTVIFLNLRQALAKPKGDAAPQTVSKAVKGNGKPAKPKSGRRTAIAFYKRVKPFGLNRKEADALFGILAAGGVSPLDAIGDSALTDAQFRLAYNRVTAEYGGDEVQRRLLELFAVRNRAEYILAMEKEGDKSPVSALRSREADIAAVFRPANAADGEEGWLPAAAGADGCGGVISSISLRGCSIAAGRYFEAGSVISAEFRLAGGRVAAFASITRASREKGRWLYRADFLKLPPAAVIAINEFVFGYR